MKRASKTRIKKRMRKKTNTELVETINTAKKNSGWIEVARHLSSPTKEMKEVNLSKIDSNAEEGDTIVIPGKVLGSGEITKKIRVCAFKFSQEAAAKLKNKKCGVAAIIEEIKINPKASGIKIIL